MSRLDGRAALVTGGRQGIGRAIVNAFVAEGADVATCGRGERPQDLPPTLGWHQAGVSSLQPPLAHRSREANLSQRGSLGSGFHSDTQKTSPIHRNHRQLRAHQIAHRLHMSKRLLIRWVFSAVLSMTD